MLLEKNEKKKLFLTIGVILIIGVLLTVILINKFSTKDPLRKKQPEISQKKDVKEKSTATTQKNVVKGDIVVLPPIDYHDLKREGTLKELMGNRKENLGIKKSLDMIVKSDEAFTIGENKISMRDILEHAFAEKGDVFEEKIDTSGAVIPQKIKEYGIYVVQPGDNIWNIHFNILKEYYEDQGINVSPKADEPIDRGLSSGVGKILKFSETMVIIYNIRDRKVDSNIDLLEPLSKIVVYNMDEVFSLLKEVNYNTIDRIQFDGKTIWIPAKKS